MPSRPTVLTVMVIATAAACATAGQADTQPATAPASRPAPTDLRSRHRLADEFVKRSDRYMHQSRLRRGMGGYGLTVMAGTRIEKFQATVVSVLRNMYPHQDMILCRLAGLGLERTGIISGMSGSPVYIKDPADGKSKLIGAVAYGWSFQNVPIAGIQPISQMLAIRGVPLPGAARATPTRPAAAGPADKARPALDERLVRLVLDPRKLDFAALASRGRFRTASARRAGPGRLLPLATPIMISGGRPGTLDRAREIFAGTGFVPVQAGSAGKAEAEAARGARLEPGSGISILLATGDADWAAIGTTTETIGDYVLAFGHSFFAEGRTRLPMGPAYVHTVISSQWSSFKISATLRLTGALTSDEYTAVGGRVGAKAEMIPMKVVIRWGADQRVSRFRIVRHRWFTPLLAFGLVAEALLANRDLPDYHTVDYAVQVKYGKLGAYRAANRSSGGGMQDIGSDLSRPIVALVNTTLGKPVYPTSIDVQVSVQPVQKTAAVLSLKLDRHAYRPGQKVTGKVAIKPFRRERTSVDVAMELPDDLPDGQYTLTACSSGAAAGALIMEMPHRYRPRTVEQLFGSLQEAVRSRQDRVYLRMPLGDGGLAVRKNELEHLPASLAEILAKAAPMDARAYRRAKVASFPAGYVISRSAQASFTVARHPQRQN